MSEESAESATPTEGVDSTETSSPDLSAEVAALRERLDAQESTDTGQEIPNDALMEYLLGDEGGESDDEPAQTPQLGQPGEQDELLDTLNAYVEEAAQGAINPVIEQIRNERNAEKLEALATQYPDLKTPEVLDSIGQELGKLADSIGNPAVRTDPRLVEMAYMAHKARLHAAAETPATPTQGNVETGSISQPDSGVDEDEAIVKAILGAGGGTSKDRDVLLG